MHEIACFISPHGFGHATRVMAILEALDRLHPGCRARLFTTVPEALFAALPRHSYHQEPVDIGLVQDSALTVDIPATCRRLDAMLPFGADRLARLAEKCADCALILADIAPLGIAVGRAAGIPTVLVESFTWDWIYGPYCQRFPGLERHVRYLGDLFQQADYRIQTEPLCREAPRNLHCGPIFRGMRLGKDLVRARLPAGDRRLVLISLGGFPETIPDLSRLQGAMDLFFVVAGQQESARVGSNCLLLSRDTDLGHPDLIAAADLVVCKAGYSTIAECCQAGARVIAVERKGYPESPPLLQYLSRVLGGVAITPEQYRAGDWLPLARKLLAGKRPTPARENGADRVAAFISGLQRGLE